MLEGVSDQDNPPMTSPDARQLAVRVAELHTAAAQACAAWREMYPLLALSRGNRPGWPQLASSMDTHGVTTQWPGWDRSPPPP
jgi:hypothetical protein